MKELELTAVAGEPVYLATLERGETRIVPVSGPARQEFDRQSIIRLIDSASQPGGLADARVIDRYDAYYLDRHKQRPLPVILARLNDAEHTRYYIDPKTARVVGSYSSRTWMSRWLYHGLHSLDFPWRRLPAALGHRRDHVHARRTALCVTSVRSGAAGDQ